MSADDLQHSERSISETREQAIERRHRRTKDQMAADAAREQDAKRTRQSGKDAIPRSRFDATRRSVDLDAITALTKGDKLPSPSRDGGTRDQEARAKGADEAAAGKPLTPEKKPAAADQQNKELRSLFGEADEESDAAAKKGKARSLTDFATEHDLDVKDLYGLVVPGDEGEEPLTVGQLKDQRKEMKNFETYQQEFEERQELAWSEVYQARTDIDGVLQELTDFATPEQLNGAFQSARERHATRLRIGYNTLMERFPQWRDASVMQADRNRISGYAEKQLGISRREFGQIHDPRIIIGLNRLERLSAWFQKAHEGGRPELKSNSSPPSGRRAPPADRQQQAKQLAASGDKLGAIAKLLG